MRWLNVLELTGRSRSIVVEQFGTDLQVVGDELRSYGSDAK
jgi:hypothetical protein